jgi:hypothetical protein
MPQLASLPGPAVINTGKADIKPGKTLRLRHATTRSATCLVLLVPFVSTKLSEQTSLAANPLLTTAQCRGHQVSPFAPLLHTHQVVLLSVMVFLGAVAGD